MAAPPTAKPRILALVSHIDLASPPSRLAREIHGVLPAYAGLAEIRVVDCPFEDALGMAEEVQRADEVDVVVCAGATGAYLRQHLTCPVVLMQVGGYDLMRALEQARRLARGGVAVLSYRRTIPELEAARRLLSIEVRQGAYTDVATARALVERLAAEGCGAIVGSSMVTEIAEQQGLQGILVTSPAAIRGALDDALALWRGGRADALRRQRLDAILMHLTDGVVAVDAQGSVQAVNAAMARLLDRPPARAIGRDIAAVAPQLGLAEVLETGEARTSRVVAIGGRTVLAHAFPLREGDGTGGAVLICQEAGAVHRAGRELRLGNRRQEFRARYTLDDIEGRSPAMAALVRRARRYAEAGTASTVAIYGESGTGKELLAQGVHAASARARGPFVAINCASLPESLLESELFGHEEGAFTGSRRGGKPGLFEVAHQGTILLDEVGDMPAASQTRLLRVLQEREVVRVGGTRPTPVDVRVVAATHRDLAAEVAAGRFRRDLYYRLNVLPLRLPPLRERREDIPGLAARKLAEARERLGLAAPDPDRLLARLLPGLLAHPWPGNVRELESVIERAVLHEADDAAEDDGGLLALAFDTATVDEPAPSPLNGHRPADLRRVIEEQGGVARAAETLGISRSTLWRRLRAEAAAGTRG